MKGNQQIAQGRHRSSANGIEYRSASRIDAAARTTAEAAGYADTMDLLTAVVSAFEKHAWFLRATVDR